MDDQRKRQVIEKVVKWGVGLLGAAVISPIVFLAVKGLVGLLVAFAVGFVAINFAPVFATVVSNLAMKAFVAAIGANPIETMQNLYVEKVGELNQAAKNIRDFETELLNFHDQVTDVRNQYPDDVQTYTNIEDKMTVALSEMKTEQSAAVDELNTFQAKIKKAKSLFNLAKSANAMLEKSQSAQAEVYAQIKEQVAFDTVRTDLNRAFANLNSAVERRKSHELSAGSVNAIAIPKERVKVLRG